MPNQPKPVTRIRCPHCGHGHKFLGGRLFKALNYDLDCEKCDREWEVIKQSDGSELWKSHGDTDQFIYIRKNNRFKFKERLKRK